jgi:Leucine-rich repeat (LRR) protein
LDICGKDLTNIGFFQVAEALVKALTYDGEQGRCTRLEELCLQGNQLTAFSLQNLARVIIVCDQDLRDLDLSDNNITITTDEEARIWDDFLTSFQGCCVLRRLNISGNALGPRAFEIFTRVYASEGAVDFVLPADFEDAQYETQSPTTGISGLVKKTKRMGIGSDADEHAGDEMTSPRAQKRKHPKQG